MTTRKTPAQLKGLTVGDEVRITTHSRGFSGKVFFHYDDHTSIPQFRDEHGNRHFVTLNDVEKVERPAPKPELFKRGDIVSAEVRGTRIVGVVDAVGDLLLGIKKGIDGKGSYEAPLKTSAKQATPAERVGLKIGDVVTVNSRDNLRHDFILGAVAFFNHDDTTSQPRFIQNGETQYLDLRDITIGVHIKPVLVVEAGPVAGVKWSDAPVGATHYSMYEGHRNKWHRKLEGQWSYITTDGKFNDYSEYGAKPATQKAIPGVVEDVAPRLKRELATLVAEVAARESAVETAQRNLTRAQQDHGAKLAEIAAASYKVEGGNVVKITDGPDTWKDGDIVRCITREGKGMAAIIVGGKYKVKIDRGDVRVIDAEGDAMLLCVQAGCFELYQRAPVGLVDVPARSWKRGDTVESLVQGIDIVKGKRYVLLGIDVDGYVQHRDDVGAHRTRPPQQYKLVARS